MLFGAKKGKKGKGGKSVGSMGAEKPPDMIGKAKGGKKK